MNENKTGKYFKYAIGEIILVVIGILIALQINNWNEQRQNRNKELSYLKELQTSLYSDDKRISEILQFNIIKDSIVRNFMQIFEASLTNEERFEIIEKYATPFTSYQFFTPKATTWNNLLSAENVGLISDKELRTNLMDYYSFNYEVSVQERLKIMNRKIIDENFPRFFTKEYTLKKLNINTNFPETKDFDKHLNPTMLSDLYGITFLINLQNAFLKDTHKKINALNKLIDKNTNM